MGNISSCFDDGYTPEAPEQLPEDLFTSLPDFVLERRIDRLRKLVGAHVAAKIIGCPRTARVGYDLDAVPDFWIVLGPILSQHPYAVILRTQLRRDEPDWAALSLDEFHAVIFDSHTKLLMRHGLQLPHNGRPGYAAQSLFNLTRRDPPALELRYEPEADSSKKFRLVGLGSDQALSQREFEEVLHIITILYLREKSDL